MDAAFPRVLPLLSEPTSAIPSLRVARRGATLSRIKKGPPVSERPFSKPSIEVPLRSKLPEHLLLELFGHFLDILRRPAGDVHPEPQPHRGEHFLDLVEALAAEVRGAEHLGLGLLDEVA